MLKYKSEVEGGKAKIRWDPKDIRVESMIVCLLYTRLHTLILEFLLETLNFPPATPRILARKWYIFFGKSKRYICIRLILN